MGYTCGFVHRANVVRGNSRRLLLSLYITIITTGVYKQHVFTIAYKKF